jgi:NADPH:quinone reductase-like Zn-dependent oxidoreductase
MKAFVYQQYGPPEVLHLKEVEKPTPGDNEILVKIVATTVNRTDGGFRMAEYFIIRFFHGLLRPKHQILGSELAGIVEALGKDVSSYKAGDRVFGLSTYRFGAHAEYLCVNEKGSITHMHHGMRFSEAAAICDGAFLALANLKTIDFSTSPKILINGASGSIGSAAVQLAKYYGADITAVCATENIELIKSLGADRVIDYTKTDFTQCREQFDVVFDAVGKSSFFKCRKIMKKKGVYFSTELGYLSQNPFLALLTPLFGGRRVKFPIPKDTKEDIAFFGQLMQEGKYRAVIDRVYPFEEIIEASRYVDSGMKTGNVVIKVMAHPDF